jgi:deoxyhypusine synthase
VDAGKLRAVAEEGVGWLRAERESRSVSVVKDASVEIPLMFKGCKGWVCA